MAPHIQEPISVAAVYEDGMFRPLEPLPLDLPEHTRVHLSVVQDKPSKTSREELRAILASVGLRLVPRPTDVREPMSEEARAALMREISPGVNLSAAIIEERESGW